VSEVWLKGTSSSQWRDAFGPWPTLILSGHMTVGYDGWDIVLTLRDCAFTEARLRPSNRHMIAVHPSQSADRRSSVAERPVGQRVMKPPQWRRVSCSTLFGPAHRMRRSAFRIITTLCSPAAL
jgi:hypothetical protein